MTVYNWDSLAAGQIISFAPRDCITFSMNYSAAYMVFTWAGNIDPNSPIPLIVSSAEKTVYFSLPPWRYSSANFLFANGSKFIIGDNSSAAELTGDAAGNSITGTVYADALYGLAGNDQINAGAGDDWLIGGPGADTINGGEGIDFVSGYQTAIQVDFTRNTVRENGVTDSLQAVEGVKGSVFGDTMKGNAASNWFRPMAGNDTVDGGGGDDWVDFRQDTAAVYVNLSSSTIKTPAGGSVQPGRALDSFGGVDQLASIESVRGSGYNDVLVGGASTNSLNGRSGNNTLTGGNGADRFIFEGPDYAVDTITDFNAGQGDRIVLRTAFGIAPTSSGGIATAQFTTGTPSATTRLIFNKNTRTLSFDADGSGTMFSAVPLVRLNTDSLSYSHILIG